MSGHIIVSIIGHLGGSGTYREICHEFATRTLQPMIAVQSEIFDSLRGGVKGGFLEHSNDRYSVAWPDNVCVRNRTVKRKQAGKTIDKKVQKKSGNKCEKCANRNDCTQTEGPSTSKKQAEKKKEEERRANESTLRFCKEFFGSDNEISEEPDLLRNADPQLRSVYSPLFPPKNKQPSLRQERLPRTSTRKENHNSRSRSRSKSRIGQRTKPRQSHSRNIGTEQIYNENDLDVVTHNQLRDIMAVPDYARDFENGCTRFNPYPKSDAYEYEEEEED